MGLKDRLRRLEDSCGLDSLCPESYCTRLVTTELIVYPDGTEERVGEEPPEECASCPYRDGGGPIRWIEVVKPHKSPRTN